MTPVSGRQMLLRLLYSLLRRVHGRPNGGLGQVFNSMDPGAGMLLLSEPASSAIVLLKGALNGPLKAGKFNGRGSRPQLTTDV